MSSIYSRRRGVVILVAVAAIAGIRPAVPAPRARSAPPAPTWRYIPLSGDPLRDAVDLADGEYDSGAWSAAAQPGQCVPFLAELFARDNWQLQIAVRRSHCLGEDEIRTVVVDARGTAVITEPGLPERRIALTTDERRALRDLDAWSCVRTKRGSYGELFFELAWGPTRVGTGARIGASSPLGARLDEIVTAALDRYAEHRIALQPMYLRLAARADATTSRWSRRTAVYALEIDAGGTVTVRRGATELVREQLDPRALADLIDTTYTVSPAESDELDIGRGAVVVGGRRVRFTLGDFDPRPGLRPLYDAIERAISAYYGNSAS